MRTLILAAGFGTRLQKFGETTPKGLIRTSQGTLIEKIYTDTVSISSECALVTNERFHFSYQTWMNEHDSEEKVRAFSDGATSPENRLGAIGDMIFTLESLSWWDEDLLVVPSDTYYEFSLQDFVTFATKKNEFTTVVRDVGDPALIAYRLGCAVVEGDQIRTFVEKPSHPPSTLAAIPFYFYPAHLLAKLIEYKEQDGSMDAPGSIIPWLLSQKLPVYAYVTSGRTLDVGTPEDVDTLKNL